MDDDDYYRVFCEYGGDHKRHLIAIGIGQDDTEEWAVELGAHHDRDGSGDWYCAGAMDEYYAEGAAEAAKYDAERRIRDIQADHEEYLDSIRSKADDIHDRMKDDRL